MRLPFRLGGSAGGPAGTTVRSTTLIGTDLTTPLRITMQWGLIDITAAMTSMTITERMGSPDTLSLQLADVDQAIVLSIIDTLADIRVQLGTDMLFNGQVTVPTIETINYQEIEGVWEAARTIDIRAESYERLVPGALMAPNPHGASRVMPDLSLSNTLGFSIGWGHTDKADVQAMFRDWWEGPAVDVDACVNVTGSSNYWWQYPIDNTQLGADLDALAAAASVPTVVHWLDAHIPMRFHWVDGSNALGGLEAAPFPISSVSFPAGGVMSMKMTVSTDAQSQVGRVLAQGALPWSGGLVSNPDVFLYAPDAMISSGKAITWADVQAFAARYFKNDSRVGLTGTATIPAGYDGWHKGQWVSITDPGHELDAQGFLVQGVTVRLIAGGVVPEIEYDITFGDAPRRSLASESANPTIEVVAGPAVRYAMRTDPEQATPKPGKPVTIIASLTDGVHQDTIPTGGIGLRWDLSILGTVVADPTLTSQAYYLENATGTTNEQGQAQTVAHTGSAYDPVVDTSSSVTAVTEQPA